MALAQRLLPTLNRARSVAGRLGFRPYTVEIVRVNTAGAPWDGVTADAGEQVTAITEANNQPPKVRWITPKDYLAGYPPDVEIEIKLTPGLAITIEDLTDISEHTFWRLRGPNFGPNGTRFRRVHLDTSKSLAWVIGLKRISTSDAT